LISARIAWRCWVLGLLLVWQGLALAAPQINWGEMLAQAQGKETREGLEIDLRQRWEATLVGSVQQTNDIPLASGRAPDLAHDGLFRALGQ
jgi:hypothetical protein